MTAIAVLMPDATSTTTAPRSEGAMGRFWPSARPASVGPLAGWRETLGRFWPRGRIAPPAAAVVKPIRRDIAARRARPAPIPPRKHRPSAPRKLRPGARPRSLGVKRLTRDELRQLRAEERRLDRAGVYRDRPTTYADCEEKRGPCPWIKCRMNLYLEVDELTGAVKLNFPDKEIDQLTETCALRVIDDRGALSLEEVGKLINLTQERVSQIEESGNAKLKRRLVDARRLLRIARPDEEPK